MRRGLIVLLALAAAAGVFGTFALIETSMAGAFRATTLAPITETTTSSTPITETTTTSSSKTTLTTTTTSSKTTLTTTTTSSKATPSISTSQEPPSATVGNSIADKATVTGLVSPSGSDTVTFNLYSSATVQDSGTLLFTNTQTISLSGSTGTATSAGYTATATATDYWVATYNGDSNNSAVTSGPAAEPVTITPGPTTLVAANVNKAPGLVVLSARLTTSVNGNGLGGQTIVFKIGSATLCSAVTGPSGTASCVALLTLAEFIEANTYTASYAGSPPYLKSSATGGFYFGTPFFGLG